MIKKYLEDSLTACLFNYTRAVSFPLGPMIAIIMGFCPSHKIPSHWTELKAKQQVIYDFYNNHVTIVLVATIC